MFVCGFFLFDIFRYEFQGDVWFRYKLMLIQILEGWIINKCDNMKKLMDVFENQWMYWQMYLVVVLRMEKEVFVVVFVVVVYCW